MGFSLERTGLSVAVAAVLGLIAWPGLAATTGAAGIPLAVAIGALGGWLTHRRLPGSLAGASRRRPVVALLIALVASGVVVQTARLGAYMEDASRAWFLTTDHPLWAKHECMTAYIYAADLDRQGEPNVYDGAHYPGLNPDAAVHTSVANLVPEDPYQYPPQFLLLPRLAIALSNDQHVIRAVWYSVQALVFLLVAFLLARWMGGRAGRVAMWLIPVAFVSVPSMLNLQYGQFHVMTVVLSVAAFLAFERRRDALGGSLLAAAILAKGFPAIVLIPMLLRRRWRAAAWTGAWALLLTGVAWGVLGADPFRAFATYHLSHLASGASFAFEEAWPEFRAALLAGNVSPFAMVRKLGDLGIAGMSDDLARVVHGLFCLGVVGVAALASRLRDSRHRVIGWFALLNLAAMMSPAAWGDYVPLGTLWMLTLVVAFRTARDTRVSGDSGHSGDSGDSRPIAGNVPLLTGTFAFCFFLPGVVPFGSLQPPVLAMSLSVVGTLLLLGVNGGIVVRGAEVAVRARRSPALAAETG